MINKNLSNKLLVLSDIHGSFDDLQKLKPLFDSDNIAAIIILGDLYYCGARNIPPKSYSPRDCVAFLNKYSDKVISVTGNCDSHVDKTVSEFPILPCFTYLLNYHKEKYPNIYKDLNKNFVSLFFHHGHLEDDYKKIINKSNIVISGHTHIKKFEKINNILFVNPGSISIPRDENKSYIIIDTELFKCDFYNLETNQLINSYNLLEN